MKSTWPMLLGLLLSAGPAAAQIELSYTVGAGGVTITGYAGFAPLETFVIPATRDNLQVTAIAPNAFADLGSATNISIPAGVSNIGAGAFSGCDSLTALLVDAQNSFYSATNGVLFDKNQTTLVEYPGGLPGDYTIPAGVTNIGSDAFDLCGLLDRITIPAGVTVIGDEAFMNCDGLTNVTIPASVTNLGAEPFFGCVDLAGISVDVTNPAYASAAGVLFDKAQATLIECPCGLTGSYAVPGSVITIEPGAFANCLSVTNVFIPASVTNIGAGAFSGCTRLAAITVDAANPSYSAAAGVLYDENQSTLITYPGGLGGSYAIAAGVTGVGEYAFADCKNLTGVKIPGTVTNIGIGAYQDCSALDAVTIGSGVIGIESNAFENCGSLSSVTVPGTVSAIGIGSFENCSFLASATLESGVACIDSNAFDNCFSLATVTIPATVTNIGQAAFRNCISLTRVTIPTGVGTLGDEAFEFCSGITFVMIPASVTNIGAEAFAYCSGLSAVSLPSSIGSIEPYTFYECAGLDSVAIPASVTEIGTGAFDQCYDLASVTISTNVATIGDEAFYDCTSLATIAIPASVTNIGNTAFNECSSLTALTVSASNPVYSSVDGVLFDKFQTTLLAFPGGLAGTYTIPNTVSAIGFWAFENCQGLTNVVIPQSVTAIDEGAFVNCSGLGSITIPGSVAVIGDEAFTGTDLTNFFFTGNAPSVDSSVFDTNNRPAIYDLPGTTGWSEFAAMTGLSAVLWNPVIQTASGLGAHSNQFGFTITGPTNLVVEVEVSTNLAEGAWTPLQTATLINGSFNFTESLQTNISARFYALGFP